MFDQMFQSFFLLLILAFVCCDGFDPSHVRLVDYDNNTGNFLFRSGMPKTKQGDFAWNELASIFNALAVIANIDFPTQYYLVDYCLLCYEKEYEDVYMERKFFSTNPTKGEFHWWPIYGIFQSNISAACQELGIRKRDCGNVQPDTFSDENMHSLADNYSIWAPQDAMHSRLRTVNNMLHTTYSVPRVMLFHCECGCDRTGQFYAGYAMRYLNSSFTEAMYYDEKIPQRPICYNNQVAAQWYCEFLFSQGLYDHQNDCGNCDPFECQNDDCSHTRLMN